MRCSTAPRYYVGGVMEHVEEAGVHSGDSACVVPPPDALPRRGGADHRPDRPAGVRASGSGDCSTSNSPSVTGTCGCSRPTRVGSRTVPFISKATGVPLAKVATRVMIGATLVRPAGRGVSPPPQRAHLGVAIKEAVLPWERFPGRGQGARPGDARHRRGDGVGADHRWGLRQGAAGRRARHPDVRDRVPVARRSRQAVGGLAGQGPRRARVPGARHPWHRRPPGEPGRRRHPCRQGGRGSLRPGAAHRAGRDRPGDQHPRRFALRGDAALIRAAATRHDVPCVTTVRGGRLLVESLRCGHEAVQVVSLQQHHRSAAEVAAG